MAVTVCRDLTVQVQEDVNVVKLSDRQQVLRAAIQRGEPKCLGVSQVMMGVMVMSYSLPLHFTDATEVINSGVAWWSGLVFIAGGVVAIILDKHCTFKTLQACMIVSFVSTVVSVMAVSIYSVDLERHPAASCVKTQPDSCTSKHATMKLSRGVKSSLLVFTLVQSVISAVFSFLLFRQRRNFGQYTSLNEGAQSSPQTHILNETD